MRLSTVQRALSARSISTGCSSDDEVILVRNLERRVELLMVVCQAQWELLRERTGLTEEELAEKITEVDARDGREDGRIGRMIADCPACGRSGSTRRELCLYCGERLPRAEAFAL